MTLSKSCIVMRSVVCINKYFRRNKSLAEAITEIITFRPWKVVSSFAATFLSHVAEKRATVAVIDSNTVFFYIIKALS